MKNYLLIRFSAMGDVVIAAQLARSALLSDPDLHLYVLTKPAFRPFFKPEERITFIDVDLKGRHKGLMGLVRLVNETLMQTRLDGVLDVHNVLRSKILGFFFKLRGIPFFSLIKDRKGRRALTRRENKELKPLKPISQAMLDVWGKAGFKFPIQSIGRKGSAPSSKKIGIAPTASTDIKTYPFDKMEEVIEKLLKDGFEVYLFGGGKQDEALAESWSEKFGSEKLTSFIKGYSLEEQMAKIQELAFMLSMDSSNMHLARYLDVPVISIWGATHHYSGYGPILQDNTELMVQVSTDELACRPCSIFGKKPCFRDRMYCLEGISPASIVEVAQSFNKRDS
ncbi:MAG: glycosyltransferase family 9 protein [Bacteroidia bacterium]|nr:glycosyltransferase family 9 protein [Bacteroidia bacterium]